MATRQKKATRKKLDCSEEDFSNPAYYQNRELSSLEFNAQVLKEAEDTSYPLLERLKFLCIFGSNLDEFFMIRVAAIKEQISIGNIEDTPDGLTPLQQFKEIRKRVLELVEEQTNLFVNDVLPAMLENGIGIHKFESLTSDEHDFLREYFLRDVLPVLTPLALDHSHPFPRLLNRSLNIAFLIEDYDGDENTNHIGVLQVPPMLPRLVKLPRKTPHQFVLLEEIIQHHAEILFGGMEINESYAFRVTRDADIEIAEDEAEDLLTEIAEQTRLRQWGTDAVRLEVDSRMPESLVTLLMNSLKLESSDVYKMGMFLNLHDFLALLKIDARRLKDKPFNSRILPEFANEDSSIFKQIKNQDILVHHPFDSFSNSVVRFLNVSARDPRVVAIKITLYRAGGDSPVIAALKEAAENGKSVTAFVELKARFDEENNIVWARQLEKCGVHVVYGVVGLKTHCKAAMVVRQERNGMKTYVHLATGNYNQSTARVYTDFGYFTAREDFARDAITLFNSLTSFSRRYSFERFAVAPSNFKNTVLKLIQEETENHRLHQNGEIFCKMNSIVDPDVIQALYRASCVGVKIRLIVRGICCLKPGIKGVSENIQVKSVLGRFLEHGRCFIFNSNGERRTYLSSGDWMPRNFNKRVEVMFPVLDQTNVNKLHTILELCWSDTAKARNINQHSERLQEKNPEHLFNAQEYFLKSASEAKNHKSG